MGCTSSQTPSIRDSARYCHKSSVASASVMGVHAERDSCDSYDKSSTQFYEAVLDSAHFTSSITSRNTAARDIKRWSLYDFSTVVSQHGNALLHITLSTDGSTLCVETHQLGSDSDCGDEVLDALSTAGFIEHRQLQENKRNTFACALPKTKSAYAAPNPTVATTSLNALPSVKKCGSRETVKQSDGYALANHPSSHASLSYSYTQPLPETFKSMQQVDNEVQLKSLAANCFSQTGSCSTACSVNDDAMNATYNNSIAHMCSPVAALHADGHLNFHLPISGSTNTSHVTCHSRAAADCQYNASPGAPTVLNDDRLLLARHISYCNAAQDKRELVFATDYESANNTISECDTSSTWSSCDDDQTVSSVSVERGGQRFRVARCAHGSLMDVRKHASPHSHITWRLLPVVQSKG